MPGRTGLPISQTTSADTGTLELSLNFLFFFRIYDVEMKIDMGSGLPAGTRTKLTFIVWAPSTASIKQKMVSASSKDALKKKFDGVQVRFLVSPLPNKFSRSNGN